MSLAALAAEILADDPEVYWQLQEASGEFQDASGNAFHTNQGDQGGLTYGLAGPCGDDLSVRFGNGGSEGGRVRNATAYSGADNFSGGIFFMPEVVDGAWGNTMIHGGFFGDGIYMSWVSGQPRISVAGVAHLSTWVAEPPVDTWSYLGWKREATQWSYFYNGAVDRSAFATSTPNTPYTAQTWLGYFGAYVADFRAAHFWLADTALADARFQAHYDAALATDEVVPGYQRLYGPAHLATSATDLYTVPDGALTRLRHISVNNPSGSPVDFTLSVGTDAASTRLYDSYNIPAGESLDWAYDHALAAGEKIQAYAGSATTLVLTLDGFVEAVV